MITVELYKGDDKIRTMYTDCVDIDHAKGYISVHRKDMLNNQWITRKFRSVRCNHVSNSDWHQIYVTLEDEQ